MGACSSAPVYPLQLLEAAEEPHHRAHTHHLEPENDAVTQRARASQHEGASGGRSAESHQQKKKPRPEKERQRNIKDVMVVSTSHHLSRSLARIFWGSATAGERQQGEWEAWAARARGMRVHTPGALVVEPCT